MSVFVRRRAPASRLRAAHREPELPKHRGPRSVAAIPHAPPDCRAAIGAFLQKIWPAGLFPWEKGRSRYGQEDECRHSKIRRHFATYSTARHSAEAWHQLPKQSEDD